MAKAKKRIIAADLVGTRQFRTREMLHCPNRDDGRKRLIGVELLPCTKAAFNARVGDLRPDPVMLRAR